MDRRDLIDDLVGDLEPVRRVARPGAGAAGWLVAAWMLVTVMTLATGPMRPGFWDQLLASPRFLLESLVGLGVGAAALWGALRLATPGPERLVVRVGPALVLAGLWLVALAYGLLDPAFPPSTVGERPHCFAETFLYSLPPLVLAFIMLRRRAALRTAWTAALAGLAAASVPALMMAFACMYDPAHMLRLHMIPVLLIAVGAAALGSRLLPRL